MFNWNDPQSPSPAAGSVAEGGGNGSCVGTHTYAQAGVYTVTATVFDKDAASASADFASIAISNPIVTATDPAIFWVGLKNGDDQGTQFDLGAELYVNGTPVAAGLTRCITGVTRNPTSAKQLAVSFLPVAAGTFQPDDVLSLKTLTRIGTNPDGTKCAGPGGSHSNAVGLRLYYDSTSRPSHLRASTASSPPADLFLRTDGSGFHLDAVAPTTATEKSKDSAGITFAGGNPWREIGIWGMTLP